MDNNQCFAYRCLKEEVRKMSTSGGAFYSLAESIIKHGGVVFGAALSEDQSLCHICVNHIEDLPALCGAKYLQSNIGESFLKVKQYVEEQRTVLFVGTPCQIAGLNKYLGNVNQTLYTCDIICHGVSSPLIWKEFVLYKERTLKGKMEVVRFRDKLDYQWSNCKETFIINGRKYAADEYAKIFYDHDAFRPSCYSCHFANLNRQGDLTLGDFWGVEKAHPSIYDEKGVSFVMVNSKKGDKLLEILAGYGELVRSNVSNTRQPQLYKPVKKPITRWLFWNIYAHGGIEDVIRYNSNNLSLISIARNTTNSIKRLAKKFLRMIKR